jgi:hypothetical protein
MKNWSCFVANRDGCSFFGLCFTVRADELLRCYCDYKVVFRIALYWRGGSSLVMRRV